MINFRRAIKLIWISFSIRHYPRRKDILKTDPTYHKDNSSHDKKTAAIIKTEFNKGKKRSYIALLKYKTLQLGELPSEPALLKEAIYQIIFLLIDWVESIERHEKTNANKNKNISNS